MSEDNPSEPSALAGVPPQAVNVPSFVVTASELRYRKAERRLRKKEAAEVGLKVK